ncbi:MAG TPA: hypothetical protein GXX29_03955 [Firmicutes bacterium]|nr:hypothetical protein [Bacillota bacterium]
MLKIAIPTAVQLVIDDVGWREGWSLAESGGPFRAGVNRLMGPADYYAITELGERLGMRPQAAMVLCEWDKTNICATCPTSTAAGAAWDNSSRIGSWSDEAAAIFRQRAPYIELTMHGVGHEHWENGERIRAEWYSARHNRRWPRPVLEKHIEVFQAILDQYDLGPAAGHRPPVSAVPCAFNYYFDAEDPDSTGALFRQAGVEFVSTPFRGGFHHFSPLAAPDGGFEHGLLVIDRGRNGVPWDSWSTVPEQPERGPICGIHWPNLLAEDPSRHHEVLEKWVHYLSNTAASGAQMLAADTRECFTQWVFSRFVTLRQTDVVDADGEAVKIVLDATQIPAEAETLTAGSPLWLKLRRPAHHQAGGQAHRGHGTPPLAVFSSTLRLIAISDPDPDGYQLIGLSGITKGRHLLVIDARPAKGTCIAEGATWEHPPLVKREKGSCHLFDMKINQESLEISVEVYGRQPLLVELPAPPHRVTATGGKLRVEDEEYLPYLPGGRGMGLLRLNIRGKDIQGERDTIRLDLQPVV